MTSLEALAFAIWNVAPQLSPYPFCTSVAMSEALLRFWIWNAWSGVPVRLITIAVPDVGVSVSVPVSAEGPALVGVNVPVNVPVLWAATVKVLPISVAKSLLEKLTAPLAVNAPSPVFATVKVIVSVQY